MRFISHVEEVRPVTRHTRASSLPERAGGQISVAIS
jgi:hypothetical protein